MKRWTIKELNEESNLEFAACILNERKAPLNPYSPMATKLESSKNMLLRMESYLNGWGSGVGLPAKKIVDMLFQDGYTEAARLIECMVADSERARRERELLNRCFGYIVEATSDNRVAKLLRENIGLTDEEIERYEMGWALDEEKGGACGE